MLDLGMGIVAMDGLSSLLVEYYFVVERMDRPHWALRRNICNYISR